MNEVQVSNDKLQARMHELVSAQGYAACITTTSVVHAAKSMITGWGGWKHPRALCQPHTPRVYAGVIDNQSEPVTCKRCLAALENQKTAVQFR